MGAHYFGGKLEKTKRFQLGELLGDIARHLLLMTATPHSGKEEDFQLFLTLLDRDRFEGKYQAKVHTADTSGVMRRMVKEDLLTFEGKPLFPERIAETVPYELTELEQDLYEQVTDYVREGMNRADEARRQAPQHRRLRAHRPAAPARVQPGGDLPLARAPGRAARAPQAGGPRRRRDRGAAGRGRRRRPRRVRRRRVHRRGARGDRGGAGRRRHRGAHRRGARRRAARPARPHRGRRARPRVGHRPQVDRAAHDPRGQHARHDRRRRRAAQAHRLHRAPRHARLPRAPDRLAARPARGGQGDPRRRAPRASAGRSPRSSPRTRTARSCSPPTPPARASTSRPRT